MDHWCGHMKTERALQSGPLSIVMVYQSLRGVKDLHQSDRTGERVRTRPETFNWPGFHVYYTQDFLDLSLRLTWKTNVTTSQSKTYKPLPSNYDL